MKEIKLTQGKVALVDDEMFEYLDKFKWVARRYGKKFYAYRNFTKDDGTQGNLALHHVIVGFPINGNFVDHINCDSLDDRACNLRYVDRRENARNTFRHLKGMNSSKFHGVHWDKNRNKWHASIQVGKTQVNLGRFDNEEGASDACEKYLVSIVSKENQHAIQKRG